MITNARRFAAVLRILQPILKSAILVSVFDTLFLLRFIPIFDTGIQKVCPSFRHRHLKGLSKFLTLLPNKFIPVFDKVF